jgi:HKD family nuclease
MSFGDNEGMPDNLRMNVEKGKTLGILVDFIGRDRAGNNGTKKTV